MAYLDDVIHSTTFEEHLEHLEETLELLNKAGLKLNNQKCQFATNTMKFLGFLITPDGILPDPDKTIAIDNMAPPRSQKEVRRFLGATGFFRHHIQHYSAVAAPLTELTKKQVKFH